MITDHLVRQAREAGGEVFLRTDAGTSTFSEVLQASRRFARVLQEKGIGSGDHVAVLADNGAPYVIAMLGISWLGAVVVALNNELVADGLCYSLAQCDARLIVADERWIEEKHPQLTAALKALPVVLLGEERRLLVSLEGIPEAEGGEVGGEAPCTILYTSGTTGLPKGVVNSHDCYEAVGRDTSEALNLAREDRIMVFLPLFHTNPQMYAVMSALTTGCSLILRKKFSAFSFFDDARRFGATGFTFVGTVMSILAVRHSRIVKDHALRFAVGGGVPLETWQDVQERFGFRVHELYGMTEIGGWVSCNVDRQYRLGSCGPVRGSMDVRIFDDRDRELPAGHKGEIVVRPREPNVILSGYYRNAEALVQSSRNFWFHTGDLGSIDADGFLYFHGRSKELIRRGGEMISPVEIETQLRSMRGVEDCAAVGVADAIMGEEIKIVVVMDTPTRPEAIISHLRTLLPNFMLPRYVEFVARIPKTETEKIQRNKLQYLNDAVHDLKS